MMQLLVQFLKGFCYFAGITPPDPENERRAALGLLIALLIISLLLTVFVLIVVPPLLRAN
jgi:hypothetical protein